MSAPITMPTSTRSEAAKDSNVEARHDSPVSESLHLGHSPSNSEGSAASSRTSWSGGHYSPKTFALDATSDEKVEEIILQPYTYITKIPGKDTRRRLMQALNVWYQVDEKQGEIIASAITMMHNASLLIDDIEDGSELRRGIPSAHKVYGESQTINSANYVYFLAQRHLMQLPNWAEACKIFNEEMMNLHSGQGMELFWRDEVTPPSESDYLKMISNKTGGLFRLILRLLRSCSPEHKDIDVSELVEIVGLEFQILDDYKNICNEQMIEQKGFFDDLSEGKFSYPIAHAIWGNSKFKDEIVEMLRLKTDDHEIKKYVASCLEKSGSLEATKKVVLDLDSQARTLLKQIGVPNPGIEKILDGLMAQLQACK